MRKLDLPRWMHCAKGSQQPRPWNGSDVSTSWELTRRGGISVSLGGRADRGAETRPGRR